MVSVIGLVIARTLPGKPGDFRYLPTLLFTMAIVITVSSYLLGGIADRYFVAPSTIVAIGMVVLLAELRKRKVRENKLVILAFSMLLFVPTVKWFFVAPWLRSGPAWSVQIKSARESCDDGAISAVELVTSDGVSKTRPIPCNQL